MEPDVQVQARPLAAGVLCVRLGPEKDPLTWASVLQALADSDRFALRFSGILAQMPYAGYFWETPPLVRTTLDGPFEFVVIESPSVAAMRADPTDFRDPFRREEDRKGVVTFWNLGGDALLVAPKPPDSGAGYAHLAAFVRQAPGAQACALWRVLAESIEARLNEDPLWISTSGLGVPWLHVRLDSRPKYYQHAPYRALP